MAQTSGALATAVSAPVRIVRDGWGIPHIYAQTRDDLFFAQGFVQAQDRLFQMDFWRRAAQGRLSEILGPNFIERDGMTRRMQYVGDLDAEWASYGEEARAIASAFVRGVNAWVALAQARPPEEFVLAGWRPEFWSPWDLLNRTDAFVDSIDAVEEVSRRQLSPVVAEAIRRVGTRPFLAGSESVRVRTGSSYENPSPRYLIHLNAPGWNVIGATAPWRPGVAIGHNDRVSWDMERADLDTQDIYTEAADTPTRVVKDALRVKGRASFFEFDREFTAHGVIVAADRERHVNYTVRWSGFEPGGASEVGALALDRAASAQEFRDALTLWKMPARRVTYSEAGGGRVFQDAGRVPIRRGDEWVGWRTLDELPHGRATINDQQPRTNDQRSPVVFAHVLATSYATRQRFDIGPLVSPAALPPFQIVNDARDWDRSRATSAPGQSESPTSAHFGDLAKLWAAGQSVPLAFSDAAVQANSDVTLTLLPQRQQP